MRVTAIGQRSIGGLTAFNGSAEVIHQRFAHQIFREVAPGLSAIVGTDTGQNTEPGFVALRLQIAEPTAGTNAGSLYVNIATIEHKTLVILHPTEGCIAFGDLQRRTKDRFIGHFRLRHAGMQSTVFYAPGNVAGKMLSPWQQLPLLPGHVAPVRPEARFFRHLQRNIQRQKIDFAVRLRRTPDFAQRWSQFIRHRLQSGQTAKVKVAGANAQLIAALTFFSAHILSRDPRHRQRAARPGFVIHRDARIRDVKAPALIIAIDVRRQIINRQMVLLFIALPAGAAFFEPYIAAGDIAFVDSHPAFQAKPRALQGDVVLHPAPKPRLNVDIIRLKPDAPLIEQAVFIAQVHSHLHHAVLAGQAAEAKLPLRAMAIFTVQPGKLRNGELRTLAGDGQKAQMAIAKNKVIELAEEKIADTVGFQPFTAIIRLNGGIGMNLQLPEGQIAKLPAHMQQALPDVERQGDAFSGKLAAIIQAGLNIADIKRRAKSLPAGDNI